jgi:hypothetical protein
MCTSGDDSEKRAIVTDTELIAAADQYIKTKKGIDELSQMKDEAQQVLLQFAITNPKYQVGNVSVTYRGEKSNTYIDKTLLKELVNDDVYKQVLKNTASFPDMSVRELKVKE